MAMILSFIKTKIGASIVIALLLIGAAAGAKLSDGKAPEQGLANEIGLIADASVREAIKSGSIDWEKSLRLLEDPGTASPTASLEAYASSTRTEVTATDRFARELFTLYAQAKQSGRPIDEKTAEEIAELALSNDYTGPMTLATVDDIKTTTDTSRARAKAYGNSIAAALTPPSVPGDQELMILERMMNQEARPEDAESLILILKRYASIIESLKDIAVPQDATPLHLDLINGMSYLARAVEGMISLQVDPVGSLTKIRGYEDGTDLLAAVGLGLRNYFNSKNVSFSSDERGYILMR